MKSFRSIQCALLLIGTTLCVSRVAAIECKVLATDSVNINDQCSHIPSNRPPTIHALTRAETLRNFSIVVFLRKPVIRDGKTNLKVKFEVRNPIGKKVFESKQPLTGWDGSWADPELSMLSLSRLNVRFEPTEPTGRYTYTATVIDHFDKDASVTDSVGVVHEEPAPDDALLDRQALDRYIMNYYAISNPAKLCAAFRSYLPLVGELRAKRKGQYNPLPVTAFFSFVLERNEGLHDQFIRLYPKLDRTGQDLAVLVLRGAGASALNRAALLDKELAAKIAGSKLPPLRFAKVEHPVQMDLLWSEFFANGTYEPLRKIVAALDMESEVLSPEEYKKLKNPGDLERKRLLAYCNERAAVWSLFANAKRDRLVFFYLEGMLQSGELSKKRSGLVALILKQAVEARKKAAEAKKAAATSGRAKAEATVLEKEKKTHPKAQ
ncbi:MAG: hypothetical protein PHS41_02055 [Victivallaceae bacterium]|nr:hypothetical protein [Victivallaceae bacterium]